MKRRVESRSLPVLPARPQGSGPASGTPVDAAGSPRSVSVTEAPQRGAGGAGVRIGLVTLGCDKNTVDSERLLARLAASGAEVAPGPEGADVVVINTCGFIDVAKEESIEAVLEATRWKAAGRVRAVVAVGCLVQRYKTELEAEIPEVDLFLGLTEMDRLVPELQARGLLGRGDDGVPNMERPLRLLTGRSRHSTFLKISEGCDHTCAFCAIPLMRGKHRSTPIERLVREAQELEAAGVVELGLVSQDTTWYGRDWRRTGGPGGADGELFVGRVFPRMRHVASEAADVRGVGSGDVAYPPPARDLTLRGGDGRRAGGPGRLPELLRALLSETGIPWFRLYYMYPSGITPELVELMASEPRIVPYLDMPIQHGSDAVLKRMRRPERQATIRERVRWLREAIPDLALRTTVIVGFPGETEEDFEALLELLEEIEFDHVGAFPYSPEEGTPAAAMPDQVPESVKRERLEALMDVQRGISLARNEAQVGRELTVLVDRVATPEEASRELGLDEDDDAGPVRDRLGEVVIGRTARQAPEVDGVVRVRGAAGARPGEFIRARITEALEYDLAGERVMASGEAGA